MLPYPPHEVLFVPRLPVLASFSLPALFFLNLSNLALGAQLRNPEHLCVFWEAFLLNSSQQSYTCSDPATKAQACTSSRPRSFYGSSSQQSRPHSYPVQCPDSARFWCLVLGVQQFCFCVAAHGDASGDHHEGDDAQA